MRRQSHDMFDAAAIPDDLSAIATVLSPMLPGDWRNQRPVVDRERCVKCAICWVYCPAQCMVEKPRWFDVDLDACKGCGVCAAECPHGAITMVEEAA